VEKWVWNRVCTGKIADLNRRDGHKLNPKSAAGWDKDRLLSSRFIQTILLYEPYRSAIPYQGVHIIGAWFKEELNFNEALLIHSLWLNGSRFESDVNFNGLQSKKFISFDGSVFTRRLNINSASTSKSLFMRHAEFTDVVLLGSKIGGQLSMIGAKVTGKLDMDSASIGDSLYMRHAKFADVNLRGTKVGGQLSMTGAKVTGNLNMDATSIGGILLMDAGAEFTNIYLRGTKVHGQLAMIGARVTGELDIDAVVIGTSLFLRDAIFKKAIKCEFVQVGQNLDLRGAELSSLDLTGTSIGNELRLATPGWKPKWQQGSHLILRNVKVNALQETRDAWPEKLDLDGFQYQILGGLDGKVDIAARGTKWYMSWLARDKSYAPQPYAQLANVLQSMGYIVEANDIRYAGRERARAFAFEGSDYLIWAGQAALKYTIGYGLGARYFRVLYWIISFVLIGTLLLRFSGQHQVAAQAGKPPMTIGFFYSLDVLLPIIKLRGRHYDVDLAGPVRYYFYCHQIMGYVLASFLIAGLSGLTK
jgi:uncharacterized protein YjbI with pentapeptide repeats